MDLVPLVRVRATHPQSTPDEPSQPRSNQPSRSLFSASTFPTVAESGLDGGASEHGPVAVSPTDPATSPILLRAVQMHPIVQAAQVSPPAHFRLN